jgi:vacuolar-type H+-ATPase subunit I/STV1
VTARLTRLLRKVIAANEEETGLFERNDDDVGFGHVYTDLEQPLEKLRSWYEEVDQHNVVLAEITRRRNEQVELRDVLLRSGDFLALAEAEVSPRSIGTSVRGVGTEMSEMSTGLLTDQDIESQAPEDGMQLQSLSGVVLTSQTENFARALFRALRGHVITQFKQIEDSITDPVTGKAVYKSAFTAFFHGAQALQIVTRIANGFSARICDVPGNRIAREQLIQECDVAISETMPVVEQVRASR